MEEVPATECFLLLFGDVGARNRPEAGKTKCLVVFTKSCVVFSKCFVVFTKSCVIFRSAAARIFCAAEWQFFGREMYAKVKLVNVWRDIVPLFSLSPPSRRGLR